MMDWKIFPSDLQCLPEALSWIRSLLLKKGLDKKIIHRMELASEEALVNVINHSYANRKGKIEMMVKSSSQRIEIAIRDWGPPFDPLANAPKVDAEVPLEERMIGGIGIHLMRQMMDEVIYRREEDCNLLTLIKGL